MSDSVQPCRMQTARLLCPCDSPGKNTGVGCHEGIFQTQGWNPCLLHILHCQAGSLPLAPPEKPIQFSSVAQSSLTLCDPVDCSMPGFTVHHQLPEFTQTHVHRIGDAIQTSHPLSSPSLPTFNLSQNQGLFNTFRDRLLFAITAWLSKI